MAPTVPDLIPFHSASAPVAQPELAYSPAVSHSSGRYWVGDPYRVDGKTYVPRENPNYVAVGYASWYGRDFHGHRTANGEIYDMAELTAAHPTLPLPSYARVTNLANGSSIVVRINDRGPFVRGRIIDVSPKVAELLDFRRAGVTRVKVQYVGPADISVDDHRLLLASYRGPGAKAGGTFNFAKTIMAGAVLASAPASPPKKRIAPIDFGIADPDPANLGVSPLALRVNLASSYASADALTPAQSAAANLATSERVIQLGAFSDPANASRVISAFARFGRVETGERAGKRGHLTTISVAVVDPAISTAAVLIAAKSAGLSGAFLSGQ